MKIKEFLTEEKWTKYAFFRDKYNWITDQRDWADKCCLVGAIMLCYPRTSDVIIKRVQEKVWERDGKSLSVIRWNDQPDRTFSEVKALVEELDI